VANDVERLLEGAPHGLGLAAPLPSTMPAARFAAPAA